MEQIDSRTFYVSIHSPSQIAPDYSSAYWHIPLEMVNAGLHWSRRMSKQMLPLELMLGW
jgi:hypothetical protein